MKNSYDTKTSIPTNYLAQTGAIIRVSIKFEYIIHDIQHLFKRTYLHHRNSISDRSYFPASVKFSILPN